MLVPEQTPDEIERRNRIREALHDARAVTIRPTASGRRKKAS
jgi:hypothetical protein